MDKNLTKSKIDFSHLIVRLAIFNLHCFTIFLLDWIGLVVI